MQDILNSGRNLTASGELTARGAADVTASIDRFNECVTRVEAQRASGR